MKNKKGFSLVECVVAIALIAVITSTAIGTYTSAQSTANKEWERFEASTVADDSISAFRSAEGLAEFESRKPVGVNIVGGGSGSGSETNTVALPVPFTSIRATETGKMEIFNGGSRLAELNYGGKTTSYTNDKAFLDGLTGLYTMTPHTETTNFSLLDGSDSVYSFVDGKFYLGFDYNTLGLGHTGAEAMVADAGWDLSEVEKYFLRHNKILGIPKKEGWPTDAVYTTDNGTPRDGGNAYLHFYVYNMVAQEDGIYKLQPDITSQGWRAIRLVLPKADVEDLDKDRFSTKSVNVIKIQQSFISQSAYPRETIQSPEIRYTDFNGEGDDRFTNSTTWGGLPLLAYFCDTMTNYIPEYTSLKMSPQGSPTLLYTDYTLKNTSTNKIDYALYKSDETKLCSDANSGTDLFKYTGENGLTLVNSLGLATNRGAVGDYTKYQKTETTTVTSESETGYYTYLSNGNSYGCFMRVAYSDSHNGERQIQIWLLKKSEIEELTNALSSGESIDIAALGTADFSSRKG